MNQLQSTANGTLPSYSALKRIRMNRTVRRQLRERWSWRAVSAPDSWRHLGIIEGNLLAGRLTVGGDVDFVRQLSHVDLEAVLHVIQGLGVGLVRHEGYGQTFGSEPTCTGNLTEWRRRQSGVDKRTNNNKKREAKRTITKSITRTLTLCK